MDFQGKIFALCIGIAGSVATLLLLVFVTTTTQITKTSSAYDNAQELAQISQLSQSAQLSYQNQVLAWKNLLLRGSVATQKPQYIRDFESTSSQTQRQLDRLRAELIQVNQGGLLEKLNQLIESHQNLTQRYVQAIKTYETLTFGGQQTADLFMRNADVGVTEQINALNASLNEYVNRSLQQQATRSVSSVVIRNLIFLLAAIAISAVLIFFLIKVVRQLYDLLGGEPEKVAQAAEHLFQGDLDQQFKPRREDSVLGLLMGLQEKLKVTTHEIDTAAGDIKTLTLQMDKDSLSKQLDIHVEQLESATSSLKTYVPSHSVDEQPVSNLPDES